MIKDILHGKISGHKALAILISTAIEEKAARKNMSGMSRFGIMLKNRILAKVGEEEFHVQLKNLRKTILSNLLEEFNFKIGLNSMNELER